MTTCSVIKEITPPPIDPVDQKEEQKKSEEEQKKSQNNIDPMYQILQGMLQMQQKTNQLLEKLSEKIDTISNQQIVGTNEEKVETTEDMIKKLNTGKIKEKKMYKVLFIKNVLPISPIDQQLHGDVFNNGGIEWGDTNKWFDSEKEAIEYGEKHFPGKYKLLPVVVPISEGAEFKKRTFNLQM